MQLQTQGFKILTEWARIFHGGYRHTFEVQTWNDKVDITNLTEEEMDTADVDHFDLKANTDLPDDGIIDVHVHGWAKRNAADAEGEKLGCFELKLEHGKPVSVRLSADRQWYNWDRTKV